MNIYTQLSPGVLAPVHQPPFAFGEHWGEGLLQRRRDPLCPTLASGDLQRCALTAGLPAGYYGGRRGEGRCRWRQGRCTPLLLKKLWMTFACGHTVNMLWNLSPDHRICASSCFTIYSKVPLNWNPSINKIKTKRTLELTKQS